MAQELGFGESVEERRVWKRRRRDGAVSESLAGIPKFVVIGSAVDPGKIIFGARRIWLKFENRTKGQKPMTRPDLSARFTFPLFARFP